MVILIAPPRASVGLDSNVSYALRPGQSRSVIVRFLFSLDDSFDVSSLRRTTFRFVRTEERANTWWLSCGRLDRHQASPWTDIYRRDLKAAKIVHRYLIGTPRTDASVDGNRFHGRSTVSGWTTVEASLGIRLPFIAILVLLRLEGCSPFPCDVTEKGPVTLCTWNTSNYVTATDA